MKKIILLVIGIVFTFFMSDKIYASNFRYEIHRIRPAGKDIEIIGWALNHGQNHGLNPNVAEMKYYLELYDQYNKLIKTVPSTINDIAYNRLSNSDLFKVDLTCMFSNQFTEAGKVYNCLNILWNLPGRNPLSVGGQAGVDIFMNMNQSKSIPNYYYRDIGFRFLVNLDEECPDGVYGEIDLIYNMKIRIRYPNGTSVLSDNINVWENKVDKKLKDGSVVLSQIISLPPSSFNVIVDDGWVHYPDSLGYPRFVLKHRDDDTNYRYGKSNVVGSYTWRNDAIFAPDYVRVLGNDFRPYRFYWYRVRGVEHYGKVGGYWAVQPLKSGGSNLCPLSGCWVPSPWIVPAISKPTGIKVVCPPPPPREEPIELSDECPVSGENKIDFSPKRDRTYLDNLACLIKGDENAFVEMPTKITKLKAGMGFEYEVFIEGRLDVTDSRDFPFDEENPKIGIIITNYKTALKRLEAAQAELARAQSVESAVCGIPCTHTALVPRTCSSTTCSTGGSPPIITCSTISWDCSYYENRPPGCSWECTSARAVRMVAEQAVWAAEVEFKIAEDLYNDAFKRWSDDVIICENWTPAIGFELGIDPITVDHGFQKEKSEEKIHISQNDSDLVTTEVETIPNRKVGSFIIRRYWFKLQETYVKKYTGEIVYSSENPSLYDGQYLSGGRKNFTEFNAKPNKNYPIVSTVDLKLHAEWKLENYKCSYDVVDDLSLYMFRPISLTNPFPERNPGYNWRNFTNHNFTLKNGLPIYNDTNIMYKVSLVPDRMKNIRGYNSTHPYLEERDDYGRNVFWTWSDIFIRGGIR